MTNFHTRLQLLSVVDPDTVEPETFSRIFIRKNSFRIPEKFIPDPENYSEN
jgi:hypothetical protein